MKLRLVKLSEKYRGQLFDMMDECYADGGKIKLYAIRRCYYHDWDVYIDSFENEEIPERKIEWLKRMAYCMHDKKSLNQLKVLFNLAETNHMEV